MISSPFSSSFYARLNRFGRYPIGTSRRRRLYGIFLFYFDGLISLSFYFLTFSCISFVDMQICPRREGVRFGKRVLESCTIGINRGLPALP